jgi:hypothetical protein
MPFNGTEELATTACSNVILSFAGFVRRWPVGLPLSVVRVLSSWSEGAGTARSQLSKKSAARKSVVAVAQQMTRCAGSRSMHCDMIGGTFT